MGPWFLWHQTFTLRRSFASREEEEPNGSWMYGASLPLCDSREEEEGKGEKG